MRSPQLPVVSQPEGSPRKPASSGHVPNAARALALSAILAVVAMWLFIWLADEVMKSATQKFDASIVQYLRHHTSYSVHRVMATVTWAASGNAQTMVVVVTASIFLWKGRFWPDGVTILAGGFGEMMIDEGLKRIFHRQRPEPIFYHLGYSFPSGHAFAAVVIYGLLAYWLSGEAPKRWRLAIWAIAVFLMLLVGFSRVCLGQHYPTDVIGGYLAGVCWLWGCITWLTILRGRRTPIEPNLPLQTQSQSL